MAGNGWGPPLLDFSPLGALGKNFLDAYGKGKKEADEKRQTQELVRAYDRYSASGMSPLAPQPPMSPTSGSIGGASGAGSDMYPGTASLLRNESGGNWGARNDVVGAGGARGHFGRAQFGQARLNEAMQAGVIPPGTTPQQFMQSPEMQKNAESWHFGDIDNFIRQRGLDGVIGTLQIGGVPATMEGLRAVAHLGGKGGLQKFIESGGQYNPRDSNGTSLMDYFRRHGGASSTRGGASDQMIPGMVGAGSDADVEAQPGMAASTFDAITGTLGPRTPAFAQAQAGASQPWMGSTLGALGTQPQTAMTPLPPRRPNDLANVPARGAVPAIGQMPPQPPQMAPQIDPNSPDAGSRTFAAAQAYAPQMAAPQAPQMSPTSGAPGAGGGAGAGGAPQMATRQNVKPDMIRDLIAAGGDARAMGLQLWQQAMTGKNFGFQVVGDQLYRTDPRTGQVEPVQGATKQPAPVTVGESQTLVDPRTGTVIYRGQAGAPTTKTVKQPDGSEVAMQWDGKQGTWIPLVAPEGGNAVRPSGMKLTEAQSKDLVYHNRGLQALEVFEQPGVSEALTSGAERVASAVPGGNYVVSEQFQKASQAGRNFLASVLRKDTGAAVTASEEKMYGEIFLPQPGDKPAVLEQKRVARAQALEAIKSGLGTAEVMAKASEIVSTAKKAIQTPAPKRGDLVDGYRFKGGNPADEKNWVKVQ